MAIPQEALARLDAALQGLKAEGYFTKVAAGDHKAASYFVREAVVRANPTGKPGDWGWLAKGGGQNVEGYAEDACVWTNDAAMDNNVVDCVVGAGAPGASLGLGVKPRRVGVDTWAKPVADPKLLAYLGGTGTQPVPQPCPDPARHQKPDCPDTSRHSKPDCPDPSLHQKAYPGDGTFLEVGAILESDYKAAGRPGLDAGSGVWFGRVVWDHLAGKLTMAESVAKHRPEWRAALGLP